MALRREYEFLLSIVALIVMLASIFTWSWELAIVFVVIVAFIIAMLLKA